MFTFNIISKKSKPLATSLFSALLITWIAGTVVINFGRADPFPPPPANLPVVSITIHSMTYKENSVSLTFTANIPSDFNNRFYFYLDTTDDYIIFSPTFDGSFYHSTIHRFLSEGYHKAWVRTAIPAYGFWYWTGISNRVSLTVDTSVPHVLIQSPEKSKIYNETSLPLEFSISEQVPWIGYSLDGQDNVTITGNTMLTGLSDGVHTLVIYAEDTVGSTGSSLPITFKVETKTVAQPAPATEPQSASFPLPLAVVTAVALLAGATLIAYFRKHKR